MRTTPKLSNWSSVSRVYFNEVERLTLPLAQNLVNLIHALEPFATPGAAAFDNGCGTGVLTSALKGSHPDLPIFASDASPDMVSLLAARVIKAEWQGIQTQTLDARNLSEVADEAFSHTLSTFMICLAPDPSKIAAEMFRVTKAGGVIGLAVWSDPYFGFFNEPWTSACKTLVPDYESVAIMGTEWTEPENVKAGLTEAGFRDVEVKEDKGVWRWESTEDLSRYFFEGGNPGNVRIIETLKLRGGDLGEARRIFERLIREEYGCGGGAIEGVVKACLATGRK